MARSPDAAPERHSLASLGIQTALLEGDPALAFGMVADLMAEGMPFERILFDVLERDVGASWLQADYRIAEEHASSAAMETVVALLAGSFDMPEEGTHAVVACAEGDDHSLPARMVAAYLAYLGWRVTFLGATLPADDLGGFLADEQPDALLLSGTTTPNLTGARACVRAAHAAGVPVIAGGRAFGGDGSRAAAVGADLWIGDARDLDHALDGWAPDIAATEAAAAPDAEPVELAETLPGLIEGAVAQDPGTATIGSVRADLRLLGNTLAAAVLVDDAEIVSDHLAWHRVRHGAHQDVIATDDLVRTLHGALPDWAVRAREMLAAV